MAAHLASDIDSWACSSLDQVKDVQTATLLQASLTARKTAYAPYSKFSVGAAVLTPDGSIFQGANVENACYGLGVCAEVSAVSRAISEGHRDILAVAVSADAPNGQFTSPCGRCRQFIAEFANLDIPVHMIRVDGIFRTAKLGELLPLAFTPRTLLGEKKTV